MTHARCMLGKQGYTQMHTFTRPGTPSATRTHIAFRFISTYFFQKNALNTPKPKKEQCL